MSSASLSFEEVAALDGPKAHRILKSSVFVETTSLLPMESSGETSFCPIFISRPVRGRSIAHVHNGYEVQLDKCHNHAGVHCKGF